MAHRLETSLVVAVAGPLVGSVAATAMVVIVGAEHRATTLVLAVDLVLGAVSVLGIAAIAYVAAVVASGGMTNPGPVVDDVAGFVLAPSLLRFLIRLPADR